MKQKYAIALMVLIAGLLLLVSLIVARDYTTTKKLVITVNDAPLAGGYDSTVKNLNISGNGRYFLYESFASNLDTNGNAGLFWYDLETNEREYITVGEWAWVTDDGRYILSQGYDSTQYPNGYIASLYDRVAKTEMPVGKGLNGEPLNGSVTIGTMSPDGRYIVYSSNASNPIDGIQIPPCSDSYPITCTYAAFLWDRQLDTHERISINSDEEPANGESGYARISDDGRYILFVSNSTNLVPETLPCTAEGYCEHMFVRDRVARTTELVNIDPNGNVVNEAVILITLFHFDLSGNGRYAVFTGDTNPDPNGSDTNVYVRDIVNNVSEIVNVDSSEIRIPGSKNAGNSIISYDGRYVAFVGGDDVLYVRDRFEGVTTVASRDGNGNIGKVLHDNYSGGSYSHDFSPVSMSNSGDRILFKSPSDTLIGATPGDTSEKLFLSVGAEVPATATPTMPPTDRMPTFTATATAVLASITPGATSSHTQMPDSTLIATATVTMTATATVSTPEPTSTDTGCPTLLVNGGFETAGDTAKLAANWTPNSLDNHKRVQNKLDKTVAHSGEFAFQFKAASGVSSKLTQKVEGIATCGDTLTLSAWVEGKSLSGAKVQAKVVYSNGTTTKLILPQGELNAGTYAYKPLMAALPLTGEIEQIKVQISLKNGIGRLRIDSVSLSKTQALLPLP